MTKYIDADRLRAQIEIIQKSLEHRDVRFDQIKQIRTECMKEFCKMLNNEIDSLQQDEIQIDKMLCSQAWWEEQGWIMIPPNATIEGIDSLLKQVRKKLQQEQPGLPGIEESGIPGKDYIPVEWVDACEMYGKWKIVKQEQPEVDLEKEIKNYLATKCAGDDEPSVSEIARHFYELARLKYEK